MTDNSRWLFFLSPVVFTAIQVTAAGWLWYLLVAAVPPNVIACMKLLVDLGASFRCGPTSGLGLVVLPVVFFQLLGYGDTQYQPEK